MISSRSAASIESTALQAPAVEGALTKNAVATKAQTVETMAARKHKHFHNTATNNTATHNTGMPRRKQPKVIRKPGDVDNPKKHMQRKKPGCNSQVLEGTTRLRVKPGGCFRCSTRSLTAATNSGTSHLPIFRGANVVAVSFYFGVCMPLHCRRKILREELPPGPAA